MIDQRSRILVIQTAYLGDATLTTALLRGLRLGLAPRKLDLLLGRPYQALLEDSPWLDQVLLFDKKGQDRGLLGLVRVANYLRGNYDLALVGVRSWRIRLALRMAHIPGRIAPPINRRTHVERLASLAPEVDWARVGLRTSLDVGQAALDEVAARLAAQGLSESEPLLALHPGSNWETKRWPANRFGQVAKTLGLPTIILGTAGDRGLSEAVAAAAGSGARLINLCGETDLRQLKAWLRRSSLLVTNDSGPMHVAEALGTPVVGVFGSTAPSLGFGPRLPSSRVVEIELGCRPCGRHGRRACPERHFRCMLDLEPASVSRAALEILASGKDRLAPCWKSPTSSETD